MLPNGRVNTWSYALDSHVLFMDTFPILSYWRVLFWSVCHKGFWAMDKYVFQSASATGTARAVLSTNFKSNTYCRVTHSADTLKWGLPECKCGQHLNVKCVRWMWKRETAWKTWGALAQKWNEKSVLIINHLTLVSNSPPSVSCNAALWSLNNNKPSGCCEPLDGLVGPVWVITRARSLTDWWWLVVSGSTLLLEPFRNFNRLAHATSDQSEALRVHFLCAVSLVCLASPYIATCALL